MIDENDDDPRKGLPTKDETRLRDNEFKRDRDRSGKESPEEREKPAPADDDDDD